MKRENKIKSTINDLDIIVHEAKARILHLLHKALTEILAVQPIMSSLLFAQVHATSRRR